MNHTDAGHASDSAPLTSAEWYAKRTSALAVFVSPSNAQIIDTLLATMLPFRGQDSVEALYADLAALGDDINGRVPNQNGMTRAGAVWSQYLRVPNDSPHAVLLRCDGHGDHGRSSIMRMNSDHFLRVVETLAEPLGALAQQVLRMTCVQVRYDLRPLLSAVPYPLPPWQTRGGVGSTFADRSHGKRAMEQ